MATRPEIERLAIVETEVKNVNKAISSLDKKMDVILDNLNNLDRKYVTRREMNLLRAVIATLLAFCGVVADRIWR